MPLYVAQTRAEERLFVGGALGVRDRNGPPQASRYRAVEQALDELGCGWSDPERWGRELRFGDPVVAGRKPTAVSEPAILLPGWLRQPAPAEERPPAGRSLLRPWRGRRRPPAAGAGAEGGGAARPAPAPAVRAPCRGVERDRRRALGGRWLERSAGSPTRPCEALLDDACRVIEDPRFAELFGAGALSAEAPVAAVIGDGVVVSEPSTGAVRRRRPGARRRLQDRPQCRRHSTTSPPPIRQMAAYQAALRVIFPNSAVEAALLYTAAPVLHALPDALLAALPADARRGHGWPMTGAAPLHGGYRSRTSRGHDDRYRSRSSRTCWAPRGWSSSISGRNGAVRAG